jgi:asparagine synthase (glutamine-hydrolysing)
MLERMKHRGPDGTLCWASSRGEAAIGHARLRAFTPEPDVSPPDLAEAEDLVVAIDGPVTNRVAMLARAGKHPGAGVSEAAAAALAAYRCYGQECVSKLDGPFTLAIWDRRTKTLLLSRDKLGERSLYYWVDPDAETLVFASEIKALLAHPGVRAELDTSSLSIYFAFGYIPGERTLFRNVRKLLPGESLSFTPGRQPVTSKYWRLPRIADGTDDERFWIESLRELFLEGLGRYVDGARRVGVFLSGGLDSSILVAGLRELGVAHIGTFTVGFMTEPMAGKDEDLRYARLVAERFGTEHHEVILGPAHDPRAGLSEAIRKVDDLVMTPNSYSKYVLASAAREAGFNSILTGSAAAGACGVHRKFLNAKKRDKLLRKTDECTSNEQRFYRLRSRLFDLDLQKRLFRRAPEISKQDILAVLRAYIGHIESEDFFRLFLFSNLAVTSSEKTLRVLENVGAMAAVEIRSPYLDCALVECSTALPATFDGGRTYATLKTHMKKAFERDLPAEVLARKVIGYPSYYWNNGELAELQRRLLGRASVERVGLFDYDALHALIEEEKHDEKKSAGKYAWALTQFALWYEHHFDPGRTRPAVEEKPQEAPSTD